MSYTDAVQIRHDLRSPGKFGGMPRKFIFSTLICHGRSEFQLHQNGAYVWNEQIKHPTDTLARMGNVFFFVRYNVELFFVVSSDAVGIPSAKCSRTMNVADIPSSLEPSASVGSDGRIYSPYYEVSVVLLHQHRANRIAYVCRSNKSPWVCLTCSSVHCGRYVNGHAKKHYEDAQNPSPNHKKLERAEVERLQHTVCMDCSSYSTFCYRCDDFVVNDTKLGSVQKVREHLQNLENSAFAADRHRKRKLSENVPLNSKLLKINGNGAVVCATGLRNLGNTCFMNAILQSLSNIQQFCCYFKELPAVELRNGKTAGRRTYHTRSQGEVDVSLVEEFRKTLCALWQGNQTAFSPESLFYVVWKIMPNFRGYQQQDAHEFMRYLLDHLHLELQGGYNGVLRSIISQENSGLTSSKKCCINGASTVVTSVFGGVLQNEVNCLICGTESRKFDPFLDLSLDIPSQFRIKRSKNQENGPMCTLQDCLQSFTDLEELDETELYMCHKCKKKQKSTKKFWIQKLPKVLCLHLKRFHWTAYLRNKVDTYVEFPLRDLDMKYFLLEPENSGPEACLYDLVAVVVHHGSGVGSGHYTAYATHEGRWFHFNDSTVTMTDEETVVKAKAYILFYVGHQTKVVMDTL